MIMKISKEELKEVVRRVLTYYICRKECAESGERILFIVPLYPVGLSEMLLEYGLYGKMENIDFVLEESYLMIPELKGGRVFCGDDRKDIQYVFRALMHYQRLELYSPSLEFLRAVKEGRDENILVRIVLCSLLMKKPVTVRQPYQPGELPEGRFGKAVKDMQSDLWDMGVSFAGLHMGIEHADNMCFEKEYGLITEYAVEKAFKEGIGELDISKSSVITPLGMERAKELGIHIIKR